MHSTPSSKTGSERLFTALVRHPWWVLLPLAALMLLALLSLKDLAKDTRSDAFLASDNPALVYRNLIRERFGLSDPLLVALVADGPEGIYRTDILQSVVTLTDAIKALPNIDHDNVRSLATESLISGSDSAIEVHMILDPMPTDATQLEDVRAKVEDFPLFTGTLVAEQGEATLIVAQLLDERFSETSYNAIRELLASHQLSPGVVAHVAGEGAIAGYLGTYIDSDARRLVPLAGLIIFIIIVVAFRRVSPALLALVVVIASLAIALGSMAALGIPYYVITNALPVILIGIAVADTVHICSHFFKLQSFKPQQSRESLVVETLCRMWLPVTITSLTTAAGFLALYLSSDMPPFKYFGLFAALGVAAAWLYSIVALPALMLLVRMQVHPHFIARQDRDAMEGPGPVLRSLRSLSWRRPRRLITAFFLLGLAGAWAASQLRVDDDRIALFHVDEPIVLADRAMNRHFHGSNTLDIVIETAQPEGLFEPAVLRRIESLQRYAESLPHVTGSSSIVDYLKQMNRVLNNHEAAAYVLPQSRELVAQYFLLYSFAADPADFEQEVDYDYRTANVRVTMNHGGYQQIARVVEALEPWLAREFSGDSSATLSGRVSVNYHWLRSIGESHFAGLLIALLLVWALASLCFRSALGGVYTLVPVLVSVLFVYGFMVASGMTLGVGTSMFAAVAIGLGVDFAVHAISRLRYLYRESGGKEALMFSAFFSTTGRALLLNLMAVACGFAVLVFSQVSQLRDFGSIVVLSMAVSFLASVTLLPALILLFRPRFLTRATAGGRLSEATGVLTVTAKVAFVLVVAAVWLARSADAAESLTADQVVARVNAVDQGEHVIREILFRTTDRRGRSRERETVSFRRYFGEQRRLVMFFTAPANIRDTAVLTVEYGDAERPDDQWLYLPALRRSRRIPSSERGDAFLGTDFSFEDMRLDGKLSVVDYEYSLLESAEMDRLTLDGVPRSEAIARELGYSRTQITVDTSNWMILRVEFRDLRGQHLKTLRAEDIRKVDDIWTRHRLVMENHQSGHRTELLFTNVDYRSPVSERLFTQQALRRGQ